MSDIFPSQEHRNELLMRLKLLGVSQIDVSFSGSGDSGSINDVNAISATGEEIDLEAQPTMSWLVPHSSHNPLLKRWETTYVPKDFTLPELLEQITTNALEESDLDWYNNDGGQGALTIDFRESPPKIELLVGVNYTQTNEHKFVFSGMLMQRGDDEEESEDAPSTP